MEKTPGRSKSEGFAQKPEGVGCALRRRAFAVIELIGVLSIICLVAAAVVPNVIQRIDRAAWTKEKADLQAMADAYTRSVVRNKTITNYSGIPRAIANEMSLPLSAITTTPRGWARAFLVDPGFNIGGGKSYTQSNNGTDRPTSARLMIISSLAGSLPVTNSDNNSDFQAIWDTPEGNRPSPWTTGPKGEDILITKCDLGPLFYELILINHDTQNPAYFSIDSTNIIAVPTNPRGLGADRYYLDGTVVGLNNCTGVLETKYLLKRNVSFIFEYCAWSGGLQSGQTVDPVAPIFASKAYNFYHAANNPSAQSGGSVFSVLTLMYSFLFDYTLWAKECPHFDTHGTSTSPESTLLKNVGGNSGSLDPISGSGGLLK